MKLVCQSCDTAYRSLDPVWRCRCGGFLRVDFHARFPLKKISKRKPTLWRYREAIPLTHDRHIVSFDEGCTPLTEERLYGRRVFFKQDHLFPSGSYKDRGASVLVSKMQELGIKHVVEDSSGNAGAAIAAYSAKANINCHIYVPATTSTAKLLQIEQYGAVLYRIQGSREDAAKAAFQQATTAYYASHYWNPFFFHGTKTCIFEIVEQLKWEAPDVCLIPVGNGTLLLGTFIGLKELQQDGIIDHLPRLIGVQAKNCAPIAYAKKTHGRLNDHHWSKLTVAEGIAIQKPIRMNDILHAIQETNGEVMTVTEKEILDALTYIRHKGYYIEPTSAVTIAAFKKSHFTTNEVVVLPLTGHGLKQKN